MAWRLETPEDPSISHCLKQSFVTGFLLFWMRMTPNNSILHQKGKKVHKNNLSKIVLFRQNKIFCDTYSKMTKKRI